MSGCVQHRYVYAGVRYANGENNLPGSGAQQRYYAHWYFCERCLEPRVEKIKPIEGDNTYGNVKFNASPGDARMIVPDHDRSWGR